MSGRVLFYVQHLLGIGHLARASRVAAALAEAGFDTTVVTGGMPVEGFPGAGVRHVALPAVTSADEGFSGLVDAEGRAVDKPMEERRCRLLLETFHAIRPDILIVEAFPFGRRQMRFELLPLLDAAIAAAPRPLVVTSVRDILQQRTKPGRDVESADLVASYFDRVLVHGDPAFVRLEETFPLAERFADKIAYTGLVAAPLPSPSPEHFDVVVSAGGGAAGRDLIASALDAARMLPQALSWCLVTGPNLPRQHHDATVAAAPANIAIHRFRADFRSLLASARLSVSQAGYNTVCDILQAGCRSVLAPFASGGETEQTVRAERLAARGRAAVVAEQDLDGAALARVIDLSLVAPAPSQTGLLLDGAATSANLLRAFLEERRRRP